VGEKDFANRDPKPTDCQNPSAVMELVARGGANADRPDGKGRDDTDYTTPFWDNATMCFAANFMEGDCYAVNTDNSSEPPFTHEDCDDRDAQVKVVQRVDGTTDAAQCSSGTKPISYPHPARLYCLEPAQRSRCRSAVDQLSGRALRHSALSPDPVHDSGFAVVAAGWPVALRFWLRGCVH
jgi:hypothetical protein